MRIFVCVSAFLLAAILECQTHFVSPQQDSRRSGWMWTTYGSYGPVSCLKRGCDDGYDCRRQIRVMKSPVSRCLPDIRAELDRDLDIYEDLWNRKDFQALESFFKVDALILHSGFPIQRGRAGWGQFLANLVEQLKWDKLTWGVDTIEVGSEDFVSTVVLFEITSAVPDGPSTFGKVSVLWKRVRSVYKIDIFAYTFDQ